jgi:hypothetical protein
MQKTHAWYEPIITGIIFIFGTALGLITLLGPLSLPQVEPPANFLLTKQFTLLIIGPLTYFLSLLGYHGINALIRRCIHAMLLAIAMTLLPISILTLVELSPYQLTLPSFPSLSIMAKLVLGATIILAYFVLLSFVDWQLRRSYISIFPAIFGIFWTLAGVPFVIYTYKKNPEVFVERPRRRSANQQSSNETSEDASHQSAS